MIREDGQVAIYKANSKGTGSAAQFKIASEKRCMFLEMAKQKGEKSFDWKNKVVVKLGESDICKILSLLNETWPLSSDPQRPDLKLFHENDKGNKIINLAKQRNDRFPGYYMSVSVSEEGKRNRIAIPISPDEAEHMKIAFKRAIEIILGW